MKAQMTQDQIYAFINESLDKLEKWRSEQLNLDAGCGLVGKRAGALHRDWLYSLSPDGYLHQRMHAGSIYYDDIEALCISLFQTIFYKGIMPSEKVLDLPMDCNTLTGSVNL